jgi:hypothetical protein
MPKASRRKAQEFSLESPASDAGLENTSLPLREDPPAPATVPLSNKAKKKQAKAALLLATQVKTEVKLEDQVMEDQDPTATATQPSTVPETPTEPEPAVIKEPDWLVYQKSLPPQDISDNWSDSPETELEK